MAQKANRKYLRPLRLGFQWALVGLVIFGGWEFYRFVAHFTQGWQHVQRPAMVDGFLPIGSLMSLKLWLTTGKFDTFHPAGIVILAAALGMSALAKKSFCGWICPVGAISEALFTFGRLLFGRNYEIPRWVDIPLRGLKYLLLGFFVYIVLIKMDAAAIEGFMSMPYWAVADVKMMAFFTDMSRTTFWVLMVLGAASVLTKNFWCRYLCPYGALTGLVSFLSPMKITRNEEACIHCQKCTRSCPSQLPVEALQRVRSPECMGCLTCISKCPAPGALDMALPGRRVVAPWVFIITLAVIFFGAIGMAKLTGHWHGATLYETYQRLVPQVRQLDHP